jgi:AcrR family transcriptional regulator
MGALGPGVTSRMAVRRADYTEALVELAFDRGYDAVAVEEIAARAGGTRAEFEALFATKQDCAVAALEEAAASNLGAVRSAFEHEPTWPDSLRAAAYAHARWVAENPKRTRFGLLEMRWAGELPSAMRDELFGGFIELIDAGREVAPDPDSIPAYTAEGIVGSIAQVVVKNLGKPGRDLVSLIPEMMYLAVRPYLGEEAARRELTMPQERTGDTR